MRTARAAAPTHVVHHPELARLVLELLTVCSPALPPDGVLAHLLLRLISFAKQSAHIASILYNQVSKRSPYKMKQIFSVDIYLGEF